MIHQGDAKTILSTLPAGSVHCAVTSPPYWGLRDYGVEGQLGLERTPEEYVLALVGVFRELKRVLREDGTLWLNLGDSYCSSGGTSSQGVHGARAGRTHTQRNLLGSTDRIGLPAKNLIGIPWRVAFALQADGWILRSDIVWHKPNPTPESVTDRPTRAHEYIFLLSQSRKYFYCDEGSDEPCKSDEYDKRRMKEGRARTGGKWADSTDPLLPSTGANIGAQAKVGNGITRNRRSVWTVTTKSFKGAHFATFPPDLIEPCIRAGSPVGGTVLDPFFGAGTTGLVALKNCRKFVGIELNPDYIEIAKKRLEASFGGIINPWMSK